jgi:predicted amidohydrolase YtcJ
VLRAATLGVAVPAVGTAAACATEPATGPAPATVGAAPDFVFHNGPIYTVAGPEPWVQAIAVAGDSISYVGDEAGALALAGPDTRVVDLDGRLLMPGFVEGHTHPFLGAFLSTGVDLQVPTGRDALDAIAAYAKANPTGPVRGFGWAV